MNIFHKIITLIEVLNLLIDKSYKGETKIL